MLALGSSFLGGTWATWLSKLLEPIIAAWFRFPGLLIACQVVRVVRVVGPLAAIIFRSVLPITALQIRLPDLKVRQLVSALRSEPCLPRDGWFLGLRA